MNQASTTQKVEKHRWVEHNSHVVWLVDETQRIVGGVRRIMDGPPFSAEVEDKEIGEYITLDAAKAAVDKYFTRSTGPL